MPQSPSKPQEMEAYARFIGQLYHTGKYSDLTLKCDDVHFKVHKAILCIRSPVFARECDGPFIEGKTDHIRIGAPAADKDSVRRMLEFIYKNDYQDDDPDTSPNGLTTFYSNEHMAAFDDTDERMTEEVDTKSSKMFLKEGTPATQLSIFPNAASESTVSERATPKVSDEYQNKASNRSKFASNANKEDHVSPISMGASTNSLFVITETQLHRQALNNLHIYVLAEYYQIDDLRSIAAIKFSRALSKMSYVATTAFSDIVQKVFKLTDTASALRVMVISRATVILYRAPDTDWVSQVADIPDFMVGVLKHKVATDALRSGSPGSQQNVQQALSLDTQQVEYEILDTILRHRRCSMLGSATAKVSLDLDFADFPLFKVALKSTRLRPTVKCKFCGTVLFEKVVEL